MLLICVTVPRFDVISGVRFSIICLKCFRVPLRICCLFVLGDCFFFRLYSHRKIQKNQMSLLVFHFNIPCFLWRHELHSLQFSGRMTLKCFTCVFNYFPLLSGFKSLYSSICQFAVSLAFVFHLNSLFQDFGPIPIESGLFCTYFVALRHRYLLLSENKRTLAVFSYATQHSPDHGLHLWSISLLRKLFQTIAFHIFQKILLAFHSVKLSQISLLSMTVSSVYLNDPPTVMSSTY